jgi:hypothetical protein
MQNDFGCAVKVTPFCDNLKVLEALFYLIRYFFCSEGHFLVFRGPDFFQSGL